MDDLMSKLQSVLNDEESMKQIKELAGMLGGEPNNQEPPPPVQSPPQMPSDQQGDSPDFSQLIANLSGMMNNSNNGTSQTAAPDNTANGVDIQKLMQLSTVIASANKSDKNVDLLLALKPLLKEENQMKIDRLIKIFKLFAIYPALKESGLLGGDLFGLL